MNKTRHLLTKNYPRTLDNLPENIHSVWLFEPAAHCLKKQRELKRKGVKLRVYSAYKTLLHYVLQSGCLDEADKAVIHYPVIEGDDPLRFRLECYPLPSMLRHCEIEYRAKEIQTLKVGEIPQYQIERFTNNNADSITIKVPVRWSEKTDGSRVLAACGWAESARGGQWLNTDYEQIYHDICDTLNHFPLIPLSDDEPDGPFFEQLVVSVSAPFEDLRLPVGHECLSLAEAMHEEIYFTANEIFQHRLGLPPLTRQLKPGQVVPVLQKSSDIALKIYQQSIAGSAADVSAEKEVDTVTDIHSAADIFSGEVCLAEATHWLQPSQINRELIRLGGEKLQTRSRQNRLVQGRVIHAAENARKEPPMLAISACQHANETSGIVGALRAAHALKQAGQISFTVCPLENADGYALYRRLCRHTPGHMLHAARYTAAGNDLSCGKGLYESSIRDLAKAALPAQVHLNLHGYPAHEWTRPLSGYVPKGFSRWTIPKGFFLICRYASDDYLPMAREVLNAALNAVAAYPQMMALNQLMVKRYRQAVGEFDFPCYQDAVPYTLDCDKNQQEGGHYPVTIITEAPDESIYGEDFRIAHETQMRVVLAVADYLVRQSQNKKSIT